MRYLIDGYNMLHAIGALHAGQAGPGALERARLKLLDWLVGVLGDQPQQATVVFDARHAPSKARPQLNHHGIQVLFAVQQHEADDLIEELIQRESAPRQLTVVSDDHRLLDAARRRGCLAQDSLDFFEAMELGRRKPPTTGTAKPKGSDKVSAQELEHWLQEFADLQGAHEWQEFLDFDPDDPDDLGPHRDFR